jgi:hypothetical protein
MKFPMTSEQVCRHLHIDDFLLRRFYEDGFKPPEYRSHRYWWNVNDLLRLKDFMASHQPPPVSGPGARLPKFPQGVTTSRLCIELGIDRSCLRNWIKKEGLDAPPLQNIKAGKGAGQGAGGKAMLWTDQDFERVKSFMRARYKKIKWLHTSRPWHEGRANADARLARGTW